LAYTRHGGAGYRRWLQDTPKIKLADFLICFVRPPVPLSPGSPELTRRSIKPSAPDKKIGLIKTFSRVYPKNASTRRVNRKIADSTRNQRVFFSRYLAANDGRVARLQSLARRTRRAPKPLCPWQLG